jgi:hypothetical protein
MPVKLSITLVGRRPPSFYLIKISIRHHGGHATGRHRRSIR